MNIFMAFAVISTLFAWTAAAQAEENCGSIKDAKARLTCYDNSNKSPSPSTSVPDQTVAKMPVHFAPALKQIGEWAVKIEEDDFTNENKIMVMRLADGNMMALRCFSGEASLAFSVSGDRLSSGDPFTFLLRVDSKDIHNTSGAALGETAVESNMDTGLLQEIIDGNELHVRIVNSLGASLDESFPLSKVGQALKEFRQLCPP